MDQHAMAGLLITSFIRFRRVPWLVRPVDGLKHSELMVMAVLNWDTEPGSPGMRVSDVSNHLQLATPTVTAVVNGLVSKGYVERNRDPADRRVVRIRLRSDGLIVLEQSKQAFLRLFAGLAGYLGEARSEQLLELLSLVAAYFHQLSGVEMTMDA